MKPAKGRWLNAMAAGLACAGIGWTAAAQDPAPPVVWNVDPLAVEPTVPPGTPVPLSPLAILAPRNGVGSAKLMITGPAGLTEMSATIGVLTGPAGAIPSERVRIYYGSEWRDMASAWTTPIGLDILLDRPRADAKIAAIWCVVEVPDDAKPGDYRGTLSIDSSGAAVARVPVELRVVEWTVPAPERYRAWIDFVQSPDTLAEEYGVPLWSDAHWMLIERSLRLLRPLGARTLYVPLVCHTNLGNAETMARWIPEAGGGYRFDLSVFERYLDTAIRATGKPAVVVFNVWDVYMSPAENKWNDEWWNSLSEEQKRNSYFSGLYERGKLLRDLQGKQGVGPVVSVRLDGALTSAPLPPYTDPAERAHWTRLFGELRRRMAERGLKDSMALGMMTDSVPTKEETAAMQEIAGGLPWASHAHWSAFERRGGSLHGVAKVGFESRVWDLALRAPGVEPRTFGWQREQLSLAHYRLRGFNGFYPGGMRTVLELNLTGNQRGLGRVGADFWWVLRDARGRRRGTISYRYPQSLWRNLDIQACLLAPGPDGAQPTARYFYLREGLQEAEARMALENALLTRADQMDAAFVADAWALLDERHRAAWRCHGKDDAWLAEGGHARLAQHQKEQRGQGWFVDSGWRDRAARLFAMASAAERAAAR